MNGWRAALLAIVLLVAGCSAPLRENHLATKDVEVMDKELIASAERGDTAAIREWLDRGADIDAQDAQGRTAIMAATYADKPEAVRLLIEAGADIHKQDRMQNNPFLYAGAEGLLEIVKLLIEARADTRLTNRYGGVAIIPASEKGHVETVRTLLEETDMDVNHVNRLGWTALLEAIILSDGGTKHQQIVRLLLDHGADANLADNEGVTPLQHAKRKGFAEIERMLVEAGAR